MMTLVSGGLVAALAATPAAVATHTDSWGEVEATISAPDRTPPALLFYQVFSACGPDGASEGPFFDPF